MTPSEFIQQYAPYAQRVSRLTGIDPRIVLAQAALETGYGKSAPNFNIFGIKGKGSTQQTKEFVDGQMVSMPQEFRAYGSPEESFADYAKLMQGERYAGVRSGQTLEEQIAALQQSGYATDPNYGAKIRQIASGINLEGLPTGNARLSTRETSQMDQMQQPQQPMGFMDRLRDPRTRLALSALSRSSVGQRLGEIAAADLARQQGLEDEQRKLGQAQQVQNRTAAWLRTQPDGENYARAIESGMDARTVYTQYMNRTKPTKDTYGLTPHFIKDEQGNVKVVQFSSTGEQKVSDLPEGFKLAKGVDRVDAGTHIELRDAVTNEVVATVDKNVGEVEQQKIMGQAEGQAKLDLPKIKAQGQRTIALIDDILSGPFQDILGPVQGRVQPDTIGAQGIVGRDGIGLIVKLGQLQGTVFLQAFESLKGGGQITELEGAKAEAAAARLNRFQSPQDFAAALTELRDVISQGVRSAEVNAQSGNSVENPYRGSVSFNQQQQSAAQAGEGQTAPQSDWTDVGGGVRIRKKSQQNGG